jgi:hypothetical protein
MELFKVVVYKAQVESNRITGDQFGWVAKFHFLNGITIN